MRLTFVVWMDERENYWQISAVQHDHTAIGDSVMRAISNLRANLALELAFLNDKGRSQQQISRYYRDNRRKGTSASDQRILEKLANAEPVPSINEDVDVKKSYYGYLDFDNRSIKSCMKSLQMRKAGR